MTVTVKSTPIPDITNLDTLICIGDEVVLKATHGFDGTVAASPVVYRWSPASAIVGSNFGPVVRAKPTESTVFTVETIYAGCSATDQVVVTVSPQPQAAIQTSDSVICAGEMVDLLGIGGFGNSQYNWSPGLSLSDSTIQDPLATPDSTTTYLLTIEEGACTSEASLTIKVFPQPQADFLFSQPNGCEGLEVSFLAVSENALSYIWDFGDGTPPNNESNPLHTYDQAGEYPVTLTVVGAGGCESTASLVTVKVGESSFADFTSEPVPGSQLTLPDALVTFLDQSLNPTSWIWDFGDGQSSAQQNPIHSYLRAGQYNVTLTVTDSNGCVSAITYGPYEIFEPDLFIPNVFSPNGDGINDRFEVVYTGTETYYLEVFDRWGKVYFTSSSPDSLWDGSLPGGIAANEGVYYYVITIGDNVHKGNVSLLR
jgi:gliding motility-associated-like protein